MRHILLYKVMSYKIEDSQNLNEGSEHKRVAGRRRGERRREGGAVECMREECDVLGALAIGRL